MEVVNVIGQMVSVDALETLLPVSTLHSHFYSDCSNRCVIDIGCVACWCPCIVYGQNKTRVEHLETQGYPHPEGGDSCGGDCWLHCLLTACVGFGWIVQVSPSFIHPHYLESYKLHRLEVVRRLERVIELVEAALVIVAAFIGVIHVL